MKERPILFSGPMVRAILDGSKTQTRRTFKGTTEHKGPYNPAYMEAHQQANGWGSICPYGAPGDRLWVRETFAQDVAGCPGGISYRADHFDPKGDGPAHPMKWRPSIFIPRWASRILLEITDVRVQRLQEISDEDARAEGAIGALNDSIGDNWCACEAFAALWESINGPDSWHANPWVWAITFQRLEP
jgi:hypothetical protein